MTVTRPELTGYTVSYDEPLSYDAAVAFSPPSAAPTTLRLYDAIGPAMRAGDGSTGFLLLAWLEGGGLLLDDVDRLVADSDTAPGWSALFDPARCPDAMLGWAAQVLGEPAAPLASLRRRLTERPRWSRARQDAIRSAVATTLTGLQHVELLERTDTRARPAPDRPYRFVVLVDQAETPDPAATARALVAATPAGLLSTLQVLAGGYRDVYSDSYQPAQGPPGSFAVDYSNTYA